MATAGGTHGCVVCGKIPSYRCARCRSALYCGKTCQRSGWKQHKVTCDSTSGEEEHEEEHAGALPAMDPTQQTGRMLTVVEPGGWADFMQHGRRDEASHAAAVRANEARLRAWSEENIRSQQMKPKGD
jgi:hypothetical protein